LVSRDDQADPTQALGALRDLGRQHIDGLIASATTGTTKVLLPQINALKIPHILASSSAIKLDASKDPYSFKTVHTDSQVAQGIVAFLQSKGLKKLAVLHQTDAFGELASENCKSALKDANLQAATDQGFDPAATDLTAQLIQIRNSGADAILAGAYAPGLAAAAKAQQQLNMHLPIMDAGPMATQQFLQLVPHPAAGTYSMIEKSLLVGADGKHTGAEQTFIDHILAQASGTTISWGNVAAGEGAIQLFTTVIDQKKSLTADAFKAQLEETPVAGVFGTYKFSASNHNSDVPMSAVDVSKMTAADASSGKYIPAP
jgi:branched-chain amino acid transport system substrate-binding protein